MTLITPAPQPRTKRSASIAPVGASYGSAHHLIRLLICHSIRHIKTRLITLNIASYGPAHHRAAYSPFAGCCGVEYCLLAHTVMGWRATIACSVVLGAGLTAAPGRGVQRPGGVRGAGGGGGGRRARSHCRFGLPPIRFIPGAPTYSVPLFLKGQCDRTLGGRRRLLRRRGQEEGVAEGQELQGASCWERC